MTRFLSCARVGFETSLSMLGAFVVRVGFKGGIGGLEKVILGA